MIGAVRTQTQLDTFRNWIDAAGLTAFYRRLCETAAESARR